MAEGCQAHLWVWVRKPRPQQRPAKLGPCNQRTPLKKNCADNLKIQGLSPGVLEHKPQQKCVPASMGTDRNTVVPPHNYNVLNIGLIICTLIIILACINYTLYTLACSLGCTNITRTQHFPKWQTSNTHTAKICQWAILEQCLSLRWAVSSHL